MIVAELTMVWHLMAAKTKTTPNRPQLTMAARQLQSGRNPQWRVSNHDDYRLQPAYGGLDTK